MTRKLPALALIAPLFCLLWGGAGCSALGGHRERKIPQYGMIDPNQPRELQMVSLPTYVVEPPDELEISVRPVLLEIPTTTLIVRQDGVVDLGFSGDVYVAGLTLDEVERKIAQHLAPIAAQKQIREPIQVSVRLINGNQSKQFYVVGTVTTQGKFPLTGSETVLDGILQAGLRSNSLPEKAYLVRPHPAGGPCTVLKIDWFGIKDRGDTLTNYQLFPGDRIVVPGGKAPGLLGTLFGGG
ncbi:MAG: periplasmic protein involved in polysaccharide export [Planctomycetota bacterium]|nr:periplasmic protein involved in polysaccharide export [Planctomycetota bacterium]